MMALGWAEEFKNIPVASNALWPRTTIDTAAVRNLLGGETLSNMSRTTDIMADAAYYILRQPPLTAPAIVLLMKISYNKMASTTLITTL